MIVYGDATRQVSPRLRLEEIGQGLEKLRAELRAAKWDEAGDLRDGHARLVTLFIAASELAQGLIDREFIRLGLDDRTRLTEAAMSMLMPLARALVGSWRGEGTAPLRGGQAGLEEVARLNLPDTVEVREAEGYAFYATYPEAYLEAAQELPRTPLQVIGIRSIGTGLAALVAAACGAAPPITVRPVGHPFRRELALSDTVLEGITPEGTYVVVDEGPGLSGSSFGAVLDLLENRGVPLARIHLLPGHLGSPGPQADERHRARWEAIARHHTGFHALALDGGSPRLLAWAAPLLRPSGSSRTQRSGDPGSQSDRGAPSGERSRIGFAVRDDPTASLIRGRSAPSTQPWRELSGGLWRAEFHKTEDDWPPASTHQERLKILVDGAPGPVLLKFAGLGPVQARKLSRAQALAKAGFTPPVLGSVHGFLATRWLPDAQPLRRGAPLPDGMLARLAAYLAFRTRHLPAAPEDGAGRPALAEMLLHNGRLILGSVAEEALQEAAARLGALPAPRRHATDNRMQPWEWLRRDDGTLLKADAVDHCEAHDLIGCQDLAWDVAGASVELDLPPDATLELCDRLARLGSTVDATALDAAVPAYLAFQIGLWHMASEALSGVPAEAGRVIRHRDGLVGHLAETLGVPRPTGLADSTGLAL